MTSRKTTSADTAQCSTTSHDAATDALAMSQSDVAVLAETFRLLGDQSRLKILLQCMHGSVAVGDIAEALDLSQSLVSHHLRLLRGARLVRGERQAKVSIHRNSIDTGKMRRSSLDPTFLLA